MSNNSTFIMEMAEQFNEQNGFATDGPGFSQGAYDQFMVCEEEFDEAYTAFHYGNVSNVVEEAVDVVITMAILCDRMGIDLEEAYKAKMEYNLAKSGETDNNGKVVDDSEMEKPNFSSFINGKVEEGRESMF